jgi:hypothetical protein
VESFEREARKYPGSKSAWAGAILKPSLECISKFGFDEFIKRLQESRKNAVVQTSNGGSQ